MSNDLISRQKLVQTIAKEYDIRFGRYSLMEMIYNVQKEPTAYDVEKVIEQLQKAKTRMSCYRLNNVADDRISIEEAIEIVRKGGIEE